MTTQLETNIDDMDPRLWPRVIDQVLASGALDAWITPIVMKKGRPAFTFSALCEDEDAPAVRTAIFRETTTLGIRSLPVERHVLDRSFGSVEVAGQTIGVKTASFEGNEINRSIEWDDVIRAADALGLSAKEILAAATSAAATSVRDD